MISSLLAASIETALNQALKLEPELSLLLDDLDSQQLGVSITDWKINLLFCPSSTGFKVFCPKSLGGDACLSGRLMDLASLALSDTPQAMLSSGVVTLTGEVSVLQAYQDFFKRLRLDWEGLLEKVIGPTMTHALSSSLRKSVAWKQSVLKSTCQDIEEYVHEELRLFPPREEIDDFYQDIYALRADLERIEARLNAKGYQ